MTPDLWYLVASVALSWILLIAAATPVLLTVPFWALGNRDEPREEERVLVKRTLRTSDNMKENLLLFAQPAGRIRGGWSALAIGAVLHGTTSVLVRLVLRQQRTLHQGEVATLSSSARSSASQRNLALATCSAPRAAITPKRSPDSSSVGR